jgi:hypothetical protein
VWSSTPGKSDTPDQQIDMIQADVKLDTLGYFCPMPIIMTLKKIKELGPDP